MGSAEVKQMRRTQLWVTNALIVPLVIVIFSLINLIDITFSQFYLTLIVILLLQSVIGFVKGESTKSWIPIFEQVNRYEKQKLGDEWKKQKRTENMAKLVLSVILFIQLYFSLDVTNSSFQLDWYFMIFIAFFVAVLININLFIHARKIDRSNSHEDLQGYTWKSTLIGAVVGVLIGVVIIIAIIIFVVI